MSKIKVTFVETNCKKNGPIKQTLNIIRNMDKEVFEPSLVTVWPEDADNSMIDEYKKLGIPVLSANMSKKKSVLFGKKEVGQLLEQLQPDIVQGVGMPPYRMTLGYKRAIHFVTLRNYCYEDYPDYYGKIPGTVMAFLDLNLIKKRMAAGEPFVTCSESLTKMYRSRQNMEIPYIRNGVDVSQYTKRNCDEIDDVRRKLDLPLGKVIYVYSGGFIDRKNQREAITAFLAMKKNADAVLLLLGDGTNFEALKDEFSKNTNILFRGKVSNVNEYLHRDGGNRRWHERVERISRSRNRRQLPCCCRSWKKQKYQQQSMGGFLLRMKKKKKAWKRRSRWCRIILIAAVN